VVKSIFRRVGERHVQGRECVTLHCVAFWDMEMLCVYDLFAFKVARYWEDKEGKLSAF
jgi:hypothetical protein